MISPKRQLVTRDGDWDQHSHLRGLESYWSHFSLGSLLRYDQTEHSDLVEDDYATNVLVIPHVLVALVDFNQASRSG